MRQTISSNTLDKRNVTFLKIRCIHDKTAKSKNEFSSYLQRISKEATFQAAYAKEHKTYNFALSKDEARPSKAGKPRC